MKKALRTPFKRLKAKLATAVMAATASLAMLAAPAHEAQAATNMVAIFGNTIKAYPSCFGFRLEGICFFLHCSLRGCWIRSSLKVTHGVPEVIISTYNESAMHPWMDIGRAVAIPSSALGGFLMQSPLPDAAASYEKDSHNMAVFKSADAYGNPMGLISLILTGKVAQVLVTFDVPGTDNLIGYVKKELPRIPGMWARAPQELLDMIASDLAEVLRKPMEMAKLVDKLMEVPQRIQQGKVALNLLQGLTPARVLSLIGIDIGPLIQLIETIRALTGGGGPFLSVGPDTLCPGAASALKLHYQSDLDSLFWRGVIPLESLYPASWLPLSAARVGSWGGIFPRTGEIVQQDPVRASGVIAERVYSIIREENQPHIYTQLVQLGGWHYFHGVGHSWQMLYPDAQHSCQSFGGVNKNFSMDERSTSDSYVWNLWRYYTCCRSRGKYLFSVP